MTSQRTVAIASYSGVTFLFVALVFWLKKRSNSVSSNCLRGEERRLQRLRQNVKDISSDLKTKEKNASKNEEVTRHEEGTVTKIHTDYGLISGRIFFQLSTVERVEGDPILTLGCLVRAVVHRASDREEWRAKSVRVVKPSDHDWDAASLDVICAAEPELARSVRRMTRALERNCPPTVCRVMQVTAVERVGGLNSGGGRLDDKLNFEASALSIDYRPFYGDCVQVMLDEGNLPEKEVVVSVKPIREMDFKGVVSMIQHNFGYINSDIYFTMDVCQEGLKPRVGHRVHGTAIESRRSDKCSLRALRVFESKPDTMLTLDDLDDDSEKLLLSTGLQQESDSALLKNVLALADERRVEPESRELRVDGDLNFGTLSLGSREHRVLTLKNCSFYCAQLLRSVQLESTLSDQVFVDLPASLMGRRGMLLQPGDTISFIIHCKTRYPGRDTHRLVINFEDFFLVKEVTLTVNDPLERTLLSSASVKFSSSSDAFSKQKKAAVAVPRVRLEEMYIQPGVRPLHSKSSLKYIASKLPQWPIPQAVRHAVEIDLLEKEVPALLQPLCERNYAQRFMALVFSEELQEEENLRLFDMEYVTLNRLGDHLGLEVPGLAEKRPSILVGDRLVLTSSLGNASALTLSSNCTNHLRAFEGYVHEVRQYQLLLKFHPEFHAEFESNARYNVRFRLSRTSFRRQLQAIQCASQLQTNVLFPLSNAADITDVQPSQCTHFGRRGKRVRGTPAALLATECADQRLMSWYNPMLNERQRAAVLRILHGHSRPTPYILFGPPGTGKTMTLVEAVLQLYKNVADSRLLVCAPSNSATDLLVQRLAESGAIVTGELVRLNAASRQADTISDTILPFCVSTREDLGRAAMHRVIVTTCMTAGSLHQLGLRVGHFTHCIVDEAGQATEPEALIPLTLTAGSNGQLVLAGDALQLGPVLTSRLANVYGLGCSLLERLGKLPLYSRDEMQWADLGHYDPMFITKLIDNYRSHGKLLNVYSQLFYQDELRPCASPDITDRLLAWSELPQVGFPLLFHGVRGQDYREDNSPSWFNPAEVVQVARYAMSLLRDGKIRPEELGIITPYRKQVQKIRDMLASLLEQESLSLSHKSKLDLDEEQRIKVGSVEEFQGQERPVIILSLVRSNEELSQQFDKRHNLGFLNNPKRFNVAISRAQALLIVVGNPLILNQDHHWKQLLRYAVENRGYRGCELEELIELRDLLH